MTTTRKTVRGGMRKHGVSAVLVGWADEHAGENSRSAYEELSVLRAGVDRYGVARELAYGCAQPSLRFRPGFRWWNALNSYGYSWHLVEPLFLWLVDEMTREEAVTECNRRAEALL